MGTSSRRSESHLALVVDLLSAKAMVWAVRIGRDADLKPEAHVYFFDRYSRLAEYHRARGRLAKARRFQLKADEHYRASGGFDGPPYAAAMGMRPSRFTRTNAVSPRDVGGSDDAA
ncbi:MAG TPA: hypothetical protein VHI99_30830 [Vicinamibacterales bacterium]|jgi:hypothetical protein|nr:hypothetical protein [Vicinamibacterales bacterium]